MSDSHPADSITRQLVILALLILLFSGIVYGGSNIGSELEQPYEVANNSYVDFSAESETITFEVIDSHENAKKFLIIKPNNEEESLQPEVGTKISMKYESGDYKIYAYDERGGRAMVRNISIT